jgi:hypothetical protein
MLDLNFGPQMQEEGTPLDPFLSKVISMTKPIILQVLSFHS